MLSNTENNNNVKSDSNNKEYDNCHNPSYYSYTIERTGADSSSVRPSIIGSSGTSGVGEGEGRGGEGGEGEREGEGGGGWKKESTTIYHYHTPSNTFSIN